MQLFTKTHGSGTTSSKAVFLEHDSRIIFKKAIAEERGSAVAEERNSAIYRSFSLVAAIAAIQFVAPLQLAASRTETAIGDVPAVEKETGAASGITKSDTATFDTPESIITNSLSTTAKPNTLTTTTHLSTSAKTDTLTTTASTGTLSTTTTTNAIGTETKPDTLATTVVTASRTTGYTPQQRLEGEQLQALSNTTVADALKYFSGVQIKDYGGLGGQKTINVRSLGTQHTGVFIDGVRITNAQNGTVDLGKYSLANMESVELFNANKVQPLMTASEFASASTVYLTTKRPQESGAELKYANASFGTHKVQAHGSVGTRFFADAEFQHSNGDYPFSYHSQYEDTTGVRQNSDITLYRAEAGWFSDHFKSHIYFYTCDRGLPGGIVRRLSDKYADVGREKDLNTFAQLTYTNHWRGSNNPGITHSLKINGRYAYDYLHANTDYPENMFVHYNNRYRQQDIYLGVAYSYKIPYLTLSFSPDARWSDLNCDVYGFYYTYRSDIKGAFDAIFNYKGFSASAALLYTHIQDHSKAATAEPLNGWSPAVHLSYRLYNKLTLRAFYKSVFRAPTLNDLYYTQVGRRDLKPEKSQQYDVGVGYKDNMFDIQADIYYNRVKDKIICIPQGGSYNWKMTNRGLVKTLGVDMSARASYKDFSLFVTGTWQDVRDIDDTFRSNGAKNGNTSASGVGGSSNDDGSHRLLYSPEWSFSAVATYMHKGLSASISHMYCSSRYWSYASPDDVLDAYNCTDAKVQYALRFRSFLNCITLTAECQDIFDVRYEVVQRWPMPGRRFQFTIAFKI